jgi:hypothetical protein
MLERDASIGEFMRIALLLIASMAFAECQSRQEMPFGKKDGTNRTFELQEEPAKDSPYFKATLNGREVYAGEDFDRDGKRITFREGKQPKADDMLIIYYRSGDHCR